MDILKEAPIHDDVISDYMFRRLPHNNFTRTQTRGRNHSLNPAPAGLMMTENHAEAGRTTDVSPQLVVAEAKAFPQEGDRDPPAIPHKAGEIEATFPPPADNPYKTAIPITTTAIPPAITTATPTMLGPTTTLATPETRTITCRGETPLLVIPEDPATDRTTCLMRKWP